MPETRSVRLFAIPFAVLLAASSFIHAAGAGSSGPELADAATVQPGAMVEIPSRRTRTSRTYAQDGHFVAQIFPGSINYQDTSGRWQTIDNSLTPSTDAGFVTENKANRYNVKFPANLNAGAIRIQEVNDWIAFSLRTPTQPAATSGNTVSYAFTNGAVQYTPSNDSVRENILLDNAQAPRSFVFDLKLSPSLHAVQLPGGSIQFLDANGSPRFAFPQPYMYDNSGIPASFALGGRHDLEPGFEWRRGHGDSRRRLVDKHCTEVAGDHRPADKR